MLFRYHEFNRILKLRLLYEQVRGSYSAHRTSYIESRPIIPRQKHQMLHVYPGDITSFPCPHNGAQCHHPNPSLPSRA